MNVLSTKSLAKLISALLLSLLFAGSPAFAQTTHMGQAPQRHIVLKAVVDASSVCGSFNVTFYEQNPDGSVRSQPFVVSSSQFFVMTDFVWFARPTFSPWPANRTLRAGLSTVPRSGSGGQNFVYTSAPVAVTADVAGIPNLGGSDHLVSGLRLGSGRVLCGGASAIALTAGGVVTNLNLDGNTRVFGYLINK